MLCAYCHYKLFPHYRSALYKYMSNAHVYAWLWLCQGGFVFHNQKKHSSLWDIVATGGQDL